MLFFGAVHCSAMYTYLQGKQLTDLGLSGLLPHLHNVPRGVASLLQRQPPEIC